MKYEGRVGSVNKERFWVPSHGERCGIAEYATYLNQYIGAEVIKDWGPEPWAPLTDGLLHVQHEHGLFPGSGRLAAFLYKKCGSVPYYITEHSVSRSREPEPFELYPKGLVLHTKEQLDIVRQRTNVPTYLIPHGCFVREDVRPRKRGTGKTIAAFGFMTPAKGFDRLIRFVEQNPDHKLLLLSSFPYPGRYQDNLIKRMRSLPNIIHIPEFLSSESIAKTLLQNADILVYWYKAPRGASASGAVNFGLSLGIPTLGSQTTWFDGLPVHTSYHLSHGIERLLSDDQLYQDLSERSLQYARDNSWQITAQRYKEVWYGH